jgi:hypothetical protein
MAMANTTSNEGMQTVPKATRIPADLIAMSREQCLARVKQLFDEHPGIQMIECGRTDPYICDNDLRSMIWDIEWCLGLRAA